MQKTYKLIVYAPVKAAQKIRDVLARAGAGKIGKYDSASFSQKGVGRFRPLKGAHPAIGEVGRVAEVEEERIETLVGEDQVREIVKQVKEAHPYEEPAIDLIELTAVE